MGSRGAASAPLTIDLELPRGSKAGITLANSDDGGPGCKVSRVNPLDMAYRCGLRVGDVIVALNGVPTTSHDQAIALINAATLASRPVRCTLLTHCALCSRQCSRWPAMRMA